MSFRITTCNNYAPCVRELARPLLSIHVSSHQPLQFTPHREATAMKTTILTVAAVMIFAIGSANAQDYAVYYPWWAGRNQPHHASTVYESWRRGEADYIRAAGEYYLLKAQAHKHFEEARSMYIDNSVKSLQARYELKRINAEYRESVKRPRATTEEMVRFAASNDPQRIPAHELNPVTGEIHWPAALLGEEFAECRQAMETIFANRGAVDFGARSPSHVHANLVAKQMTAVLSSQIKHLESGDWIDAKKFIASLAHETRFAPLGAVAQNSR